MGDKKSSVAGDNWQRTGREMLRTTTLRASKQNARPGDKRETPESHAGRKSRALSLSAGKQVENNCEITQPRTQSVVGDNCEITRAEDAECSGRHWETIVKSCSGRNTSPETNVKSCGLSLRPFQSKNPSQANLSGEYRGSRTQQGIRRHIKGDKLYQRRCQTV